MAANSAYGKRMGIICEYYHINYHMMNLNETQAVDPAEVDAYLTEHTEIGNIGDVFPDDFWKLIAVIKEIFK